MQGDLISRDFSVKALREYAEQKHAVGQTELANGILKAINFLQKEENVPTAYDVEKVVAEIEYKKEQADKDRSWWAEHSWKDNAVYNECDLSDRKVDCYDEALECVRNSGKE